MERHSLDEELIRHLADHQGLSPDRAKSLLDEFLAFFSETRDEFVRRRHRELKSAGRNNADIYSQIAGELVNRRFPAGSVSERQIRRIIYG